MTNELDAASAAPPVMPGKKRQTPMRDRVAIIGAGHVGATAAFALMLRGLFSEIVLIDHNAELAEAQAADIADANALARPARIWAGGYNDAAAARIVVLTAGAPTRGNESRLGVAARSAEIVSSCVDDLAKAGFAGILVVASNPVDLMAHVAYSHAGLPASQVIGTGTLLDSCRLRQTLAARLDVAPEAVEGLVIGEHGDSEVAAMSTVRVGGLPLARFTGDVGLPRTGIVASEVRDAGYRIVAGKGFTSFGIATSIVRICEAIVRNERAVMPVSCLLTGQFGIDDLYLSLPCILGDAGVERVLLPELDAGEQAALARSAAVLRAALALSSDGSTASEN
jgi:L-lactate dehydrogenase